MAEAKKWVGDKPLKIGGIKIGGIKIGGTKIGGTKILVGTHGRTKNGGGPWPLGGRGDP